MATVWLLSIVVGIISAFYLWRKRRFSLFEDLNIPGPKPSLIFGNILELISKGTVQCYTDWISKYGNIVGFYNGSLPFLIVKDTELLKRILIKDFENFQSRGIFTVFAKNSDRERHNLINTDPDRWRRMRNMITPAFTSGKMRQMSGLLNDSTDQFLEAIEQNVGAAFDIYDNFRRLTIDVIVKAAFGMEMDFQKGGGGKEFFALASDAVQASIHSMVLLVLNCLSELDFAWKFLLPFFSRFFTRSDERLTENMESIIDMRRRDPKASRKDLLQAMLDVRISDDDVIDVNKLTAGDDIEQEGDGHTVLVPKAAGGKNRYMTNSEIHANASLFLLAGFETTSTALGFTTYLLAKNQDVQKKLRDEIIATVTSHGELTHDAILGMKYMEQVFAESLRYYPPVVSFVTRQAANDIVYKDITIPAGVGVVAPAYQLHHDPEMWPEPEKFDPERFDPSNRAHIDPMSYQPFGHGPRNCVGMRFAQLQAKLTLAKMLSKYRVFLDDTRPWHVSSTAVLLRPESGVWVRLERLEG